MVLNCHRFNKWRSRVTKIYIFVFILFTRYWKFAKLFSTMRRRANQHYSIYEIYLAIYITVAICNNETLFLDIGYLHQKERHCIYQVNELIALPDSIPYR